MEKKSHWRLVAILQVLMGLGRQIKFHGFVRIAHKLLKNNWVHINSMLHLRNCMLTFPEKSIFILDSQSPIAKLQNGRQVVTNSYHYHHYVSPTGLAAERTIFIGRLGRFVCTGGGQSLDCQVYAKGVWARTQIWNAILEMKPVVVGWLCIENTLDFGFSFALSLPFFRSRALRFKHFYPVYQ